jgi:hypothetical protein
MALLRRGDLSVTEICFEVGCSSLGPPALASPSWSVCPQRLPAPGDARDGGVAPVRGETMTRPIRNREAPVAEPQLA